MASSLSERAMLAGRYAKALFAEAKSADALDAAEADLLHVQEVLNASRDFQLFIKHPLLAEDEQKAAVQAVLQHLNAHAVTQKFFLVLVENRRLMQAPYIIRAFLEMAAAHRGEVKATLVSAVKLDPEYVAGICDALAKKLNASVIPATRINSDILGGIVIQVGSQVLDASVRTKLEKMETELKQSVEAVAL